MYIEMILPISKEVRGGTIYHLLEESTQKQAQARATIYLLLRAFLSNSANVRSWSSRERPSRFQRRRD